MGGQVAFVFRLPAGQVEFTGLFLALFRAKFRTLGRLFRPSRPLVWSLNLLFATRQLVCGTASRMIFAKSKILRSSKGWSTHGAAHRENVQCAKVNQFYFAFAYLSLFIPVCFFTCFALLCLTFILLLFLVCFAFT